MDIGANLTDPQFQGIYNGKQKHISDLDAVIQRSKLQTIVVTCGKLSDLDLSLPICAKHSLYTTVGIHPTNASTYTIETSKQIQNILSQNHKSVVMFGEFGLDYERIQLASAEQQLFCFKNQLKLAQSSKLPLFIHCRNGESGEENGKKNAYMDLIQCVREYESENKYKFQGIIHSFDGGIQDLKLVLETQFYVGVNGCSLKSEQNCEVVKQIPMERMILESDCPYCEVKKNSFGYQFVKNDVFEGAVKPEKFQAGKFVKGRNEPVGVYLVAQVVAGLLGKNTEEVMDVCRKNGECLIQKQ